MTQQLLMSTRISPEERRDIMAALGPGRMTKEKFESAMSTLEKKYGTNKTTRKPKRKT